MNLWANGSHVNEAWRTKLECIGRVLEINKVSNQMVDTMPSFVDRYKKTWQDLEMPYIKQCMKEATFKLMKERDCMINFLII